MVNERLKAEFAEINWHRVWRVLVIIYWPITILYWTLAGEVTWWLW